MLRTGVRAARRLLLNNRLIRRFAFELGFMNGQRALRNQIGVAKTFNEKLKYKAAYDRRPILTTFADKIKVRDYVANAVGEQYLSKAHLIAYDLKQIDWRSLPEEFAFKANHASAANLIVSRTADPSEVLSESPLVKPWKTHVVRPENFSADWLISRAQLWKSLNYSWKPSGDHIIEWPYKNIKPGFLIEELLLDSRGQLAADFKLHVFNGVCRFINVIHRNYFDQSTGTRRNYSNVMTPDWKPVPVVLNGNPPLKTPVRPANLAELIAVAEKLANGIDYVRVDLYNLPDRIVFGEMTNFPSAAVNTFEPESFDFEWGNLLRLDDYRVRSKNHVKGWA